MNFSYLKLILFLFGCTTLQIAQAQERWSLNDAVDYALQNAWDLKTSDLDIRDAEEQIREYRAIGLPQIDGKLDYQRFIELPTSIIPAGSFGPNNPPEDLPVQFGVNNNINAGVELSTMLLDGSYFIGLKAIRQYRDLAQKEKRLTEFELKYAVREAFYAVLLAKKARTVLEANIENLEKSLEETRAFYENGFLEKLDVDRLELSLRNLRTELKNQDRMIQLAKNALKFRMNYSQDKEISLEGDLYDYVEDESLVSDLVGISPTPERRPEFKLLQANLMLQSLDIKQNKYRRYPKIFGFASYTEQLQGNRISDSQWFPNSLVGFNLSVPIFSAWDTQAKIDRAEIAYEKVQIQLSQFQAANAMEVRNATINMQQSREILEDRQASVEQAREIYVIAQIKFKEGVGSSVELTQAERELYNAQGQNIQAAHQLLVAQMELDKALGI